MLQPKDDENGWRLLSILIGWLSLVGGAVHRQNASSLKAGTIAVKAQVRSEPGRTQGWHVLAAPAALLLAS